MAPSPFFAFTTRSHEHVERSVDWFWALGVVAVGGSALSIIFGNTLLALIILLASFSIGLIAAKGPRDIAVEVHERGVLLGTKFYPYRSLKSFWIDTTTREPAHLILSCDSILTPQLIIPLPEGMSVESLRTFLAKHLAEEEQYESPLTRIAEFFGF